MYKEHKCFNEIPDDSQIWRYMSFAKFCDLVQRKALFFCRADKLGDPWESIYPLKNRGVAKRKITYLTGTPDGVKREEKIEDYGAPYSTKVSESLEDRKAFVVSCWHINDYESDALWKAYASTEGLAVKSTFGKLKKSMNSERDIHIGTVTYINPETDFIPEGWVFNPILHKRKSFAHENELRAVIWSTKFESRGDGTSAMRAVPNFKSENGEHIDVDLSTLSLEVIVSPLSPPWLTNVVKEFLDKSGLSIPVRRSTHLDPP